MHTRSAQIATFLIALCLSNGLEYDDEVGNSGKRKSVIILQSGNESSAQVTWIFFSELF